MARKPGVTAIGVKRRADILKKAEALISRGGFQEMTMDSIAEELDISKSALYHYFKQKDDLLYAIRLETLQGLIASQKARMESGERCVDQLYDLLVEGLKMVSQSPAKYRAIFELKQKLSKQREVELRDLERDYFHMLVSTVQGAIEEGSLRQVDPLLFSQAIISMVNHAQYWFRPSGRMSHIAVADSFWDMLTNGVRSPSAVLSRS